MSDRPEQDPAEGVVEAQDEAVDAAQEPASAGAGDALASEAAGEGADPGQFEARPPVTIDMPMPSFEETRVTEALVDKRRLKRQVKRARRKAYVLVTRAGGPPAQVPMDRNALVFGRDPADCDIVLDGVVVSRVHARIERDGSGYFTLVDCKSRNGTYVDGRPVSTMNLVDGDCFEIGETEIAFHVED